MRPSQLLGAVLALSSVSVAMTDAFSNIHGMDGVKDVLFGRQDNNNNNQNDDKSSQAPQSTAPPQSSDQPTASDKGDDNNERASSTDKASGSATGSAQASGSKGSKTTEKPSKSTEFDARLPAGGLSMITPGVFAGEQLYKVGDWVTFAWNYTSLSVTPSYIDVLVSCASNQATYTIAVNHTATARTVLWDTAATPTGQAPFLTEKYKLLIYDSESSVSAAPRPGYLAPFNALTFGMYIPRESVAWKDYTCANCVKNGALSHAEKMTLRVMLFTSGTTIASLLYFAHNFGLF